MLYNSWPTNYTGLFKSEVILRSWKSYGTSIELFAPEINAFHFENCGLANNFGNSVYLVLVN